MYSFHDEENIINGRIDDSVIELYPNQTEKAHQSRVERRTNFFTT